MGALQGPFWLSATHGLVQSSWSSSLWVVNSAMGLFALKLQTGVFLFIIIPNRFDLVFVKVY